MYCRLNVLILILQQMQCRTPLEYIELKAIMDVKFI